MLSVAFSSCDLWSFAKETQLVFTTVQVFNCARHIYVRRPQRNWCAVALLSLNSSLLIEEIESGIAHLWILCNYSSDPTTVSFTNFSTPYEIATEKAVGLPKWGKFEDVKYYYLPAPTRPASYYDSLDCLVSETTRKVKIKIGRATFLQLWV